MPATKGKPRRRSFRPPDAPLSYHTLVISAGGNTLASLQALGTSARDAAKRHKRMLGAGAAGLVIAPLEGNT